MKHTGTPPRPYFTRHASAFPGKAALAFGCMLALCAGQAAFAPQAWAETGSFSIESHNPSAAYRIYQLFDADIAENDEAQPADEDSNDGAFPGIATHITWSSKVSKEATLAFLDDSEYGKWLQERYAEATDESLAKQHDLPQNAAEFIAQRIGASADDAGAATVPATKEARSFALALAQELVAAFKAGDAAIYHAQADEEGIAAFEGEEGFYLFVSDEGSLGHDTAGTSPIWVPLGGSTSAIVEKAAVPTFKKQVKEDATDSWGTGADANHGEDLPYLLAATLPSNFATFDRYHLKFTDTLPDGMELSGGDTHSVVVTIDNSVDITADLTEEAGGIAYDGNVLTVDIADLKTVHKGLAVDKDSVVTVAYSAHLTDAAVIGQPGNENTAQLTYTNDPVTGGEGTTMPDGHKTRTYTYQLAVQKVDKQTHDALPGAVFTVESLGDNAGTADAAPSNNKTEAEDAHPEDASSKRYIQADGSIGSSPHEFTTDGKGAFSVPRIDSGAYVLHEVSAPEGYELQDADITLTIASRIGDAGRLESWSAEVSGGEATTSTDADVVTHVVKDATDMATGIVTVQTSDDAKVVMPITGMEGAQIALIVAGGVLVFSIAGLHRNRWREEQDAARRRALNLER